MKGVPEKTVLVAVVKKPEDLETVLRKRWYRIPVKSAPPLLRDQKVRYLAFYQNRSFGEAGCRIEWYGQISGFKVAKRKELLPSEKSHPRANEFYFKLELSKLRKLEKPILSKRKRPIVFIPTTTLKLLHATEINDLFSDSLLEEALWVALKAQQIEAERQYFVGRSPNLFALDFALFCRSQNLDVECDGDLYHADPVRVKRDRKRNNILASLGWLSLHFGKEDILTCRADTINRIKMTVNKLGGLQICERPGTYRILPLQKVSGQEGLFKRRIF
jgi:very-short-patch-repair endonuclease